MIKRSACATLFAALPSACSSFYYDGKTFSSGEAALEAQGRILGTAINSVVPLKAPLARKARVGLPSKTVIYEREIIGNKAVGGRWLTDLLMREHVAVLRAIERRGIFETVTYELTDGRHLKPGADECVIYLYLPSTTARGWYFNASQGNRSPLFFESGEPDPSRRLGFFIESLERLVARR